MNDLNAYWSEVARGVSGRYEPLDFSIETHPRRYLSVPAVTPKWGGRWGGAAWCGESLTGANVNLIRLSRRWKRFRATPRPERA